MNITYNEYSSSVNLYSDLTETDRYNYELREYLLITLCVKTVLTLMRFQRQSRIMYILSLRKSKPNFINIE
jgi:hypothetical protein